jgi:hypothetical protein
LLTSRVCEALCILWRPNHESYFCRWAPGKSSTAW